MAKSAVAFSIIFTVVTGMEVQEEMPNNVALHQLLQRHAEAHFSVLLSHIKDTPAIHRFQPGPLKISSNCVVDISVIGTWCAPASRVTLCGSEQLTEDYDFITCYAFDDDKIVFGTERGALYFLDKVKDNSLNAVVFNLSAYTMCAVDIHHINGREYLIACDSSGTISVIDAHQQDKVSVVEVEDMYKHLDEDASNQFYRTNIELSKNVYN